jgi:hypothetical protein
VKYRGPEADREAMRSDFEKAMKQLHKEVYG